MKEEWKPVVGFPGFPGYYVSNYGGVRSFFRGRLTELKTHVHKNGYVIVDFRRWGVRRTVKVHRLVLEAFVGPCPAGCEVDHINAVRTDNRVENLRWVTRAENMKNPITVVRMQRAQRMRPVECVETGEVFISACEASRQLGICRTTIASVCRGKRYCHTAKGFHFRFVEVSE